jgi:hypothetical protein
VDSLVTTSSDSWTFPYLLDLVLFLLYRFVISSPICHFLTGPGVEWQRVDARSSWARAKAIPAHERGKIDVFLPIDWKNGAADHIHVIAGRL